jgi:REP-associated tyrosine transposase
MARPLRIHAPGTLCHVMSRGNAKQNIFVDDTDFGHFLELLSSLLERFHVNCIAYCLMWNHTHLLLRPAEQPLSRLMQHLNSAYCQWFNRRHDRVGHVLQGRFKSRWVDDDLYFLRVLRYIVRNPVAAGYVNDPGEWRWSSHRATAGLEGASSFLDVQSVWDVFDYSGEGTGADQFRLFAGGAVNDVDPMGGLLVGSRDFAMGLDPNLEPHRANENLVHADRFASRPPLVDLVPADAEGPALDAAARLAFLKHAYTLREIGERLGRPTSTIWSWIQRADKEARFEEMINTL